MSEKEELNEDIHIRVFRNGRKVELSFVSYKDVSDGKRKYEISGSGGNGQVINIRTEDYSFYKRMKSDLINFYVGGD